MLKLKPVADTPSPAAEYAAAAHHWGECIGERDCLVAKVEAIRLAFSLARSGDNDLTPKNLVDAARPYRRLASKRPAKLTDDLAVIEQQIIDHHKDMAAEADAWSRARRRETNRLAVELQPRHRAVVKAMGGAIEALSQAIADEREVREELRRRAPLPDSANLPDLSSDLLIGTVADFGGPANTWARRVRKLGILEE